MKKAWNICHFRRYIMTIELELYLEIIKENYQSELDYRFTPMLLYDLKANDDIVCEYLNWANERNINQ